MKEFTFPALHGGEVYCRLWEPDTPPRAVLQIVHGIAEHAGRYEEFANYLTQHGVLVAAEDHMGHGKSIAAGQTPGYFQGGWENAVADALQLQKHLLQTYLDVPYFLLGHSMGSFLARTMLFRNPDRRCHGTILSGTGWQPAPVLAAGLALCQLEARRHGEKEVSELLKRTIFAGYNQKFAPNRTEFDWLCSRPEVVDQYLADPLCGFDATIGLCRDLMQGIKTVQTPANLARMWKAMPVWFFSGESDPVGNMGKGVLRSAEAFRKSGMRQVTVTLYTGRHEMLNETNRLQVYADVLRFLEAHGMK